MALKRSRRSRSGRTPSSTFSRTVLVGSSSRLLLEQPDGGAGRELRLAGRGLLLPGHDPEERRLAGAVRPEHADLRARQERERDVVEDLPLGAVELLGPDHREDVVAHPSGPGYRLPRGRLLSAARVRRHVRRAAGAARPETLAREGAHGRRARRGRVPRARAGRDGARDRRRHRRRAGRAAAARRRARDERRALAGLRGGRARARARRGRGRARASGCSATRSPPSCPTPTPCC